ncbi:MAG: FtsX-like permease family protein [Spirochaetia bacterium]|jgi:putative ABC transport system permease protein
MHTIRIAFRNLNRQKKRSFLLGGAIAFGLLIVTLVNGAAGGFQRNISDNFSHLFGGQVFIQGLERTPSGKRVSVIHDDAVLLASIKESNVPVERLTRSSGFLGTLMCGDKKAVQQVVGLEWSGDNLVRERLALLQGSFSAMSNPTGIILSRKIADKLGARLGDTVTIQLRTVTDQVNVGDFQVAAISHDPGLSDSLAAYAGLPYVNSLINIGAGEYQTLGILLGHRDTTDVDSGRIYHALSVRVPVLDRTSGKQDADPMRAMLKQHEQNPAAAMFQSLIKQAGDTPWEGMRYRLYTINDILGQAQLPQMAGALNGLAFIVLLVLFVIIVVGITNTFRMVIVERTREIGTMRALGMKRRSVRNLFLLEALLLFLGGAVAGLGGAALIMDVLRLFNFGSGTFAMILQGGRLSFSLPAAQTIAQLLLVGLLTVLAALYPARRAARLSPARALAAIT